MKFLTQISLTICLFVYLPNVFAEELEKHALSAKYPLYQGYILRAKGNLDQSTAVLKKALKTLTISVTQLKVK